MKKFKIEFLYVVYHILLLFVESFLVIITFGAYLFVPDKYLLGTRLNNWYLKKSLQIEFADDPEKLKLVTEIFEKTRKS